MPLYEYKCRQCGHQFEILQRLGEGCEGLECPACGDRELEKQFSTFASSAGEGSSRATTAAGCGSGSGFT